MFDFGVLNRSNYKPYMRHAGTVIARTGSAATQRRPYDYNLQNFGVLTRTELTRLRNDFIKPTACV